MTLFVCYLLLLAAAMWVGRALLAHLEPALLLLAGCHRRCHRRHCPRRS